MVERHRARKNENMTDAEKMQFHLLDGNGRPCGVFDYAVQEYIKRHYKMFFLAGTPYFYENGAYKIDKSGTRLKTLIKGLILPRFIKSTTITRIYQLFLQDYELEKSYEEINQFPEHWIPFKNCMYDARTEERFPHSPDYFCINQIPWDFPEGEFTGNETEKFLSSSMSAEDRKTIFQYLGLCMTRLNFQKFLILKGSRGTGKSVVIHMFEKVIGTGNYSNVPLQKLEEKFYSIQLLGKLLNLCADINASPMKTVNTIKLITGGDSLTDSYKGKDIVTFAPYARLFFSCNAIPLSLDEKSNALFERIILIEMDNRPEKPDRQLIIKIQNEMPYIIQQGLKGLHELLENNELYESPRSRELVEELYSDCDSVQAFIRECLQRDIKAQTRTKELSDSYKKYCQDSEREPLSRNNFYRNLKDKGYGRKTLHGNEYIVGLKFKDKDEFIKVDQEENLPFE